MFSKATELIGPDRPRGPNGPGSGAGDGSRTRDLKFGKLVLYQLSYTRARPILGATPAPINCRGGYTGAPRYRPPISSGSQIRFT